MRKLQAVVFIIQFYFLFIIVKLTTLISILLKIKQKKLTPSKDVLFLESFTEDGAGYNYRVKKWIDLLVQEDYKAESAFLIQDSKTFFHLTSEKNLKKFILITGFRRYFQILTTRNFKTIVVRRSLVLYNTYGSHFFEKLLFSIHPNLILDVDDDISTNQEEFEKKKLFQKLMLDTIGYFNHSLKYYNGFIVGSSYLRSIIKARESKIAEKDIIVIPTCVDYDKYPRKIYSDALNKIVFGWIGGNHNLSLVHTVIPALNEANNKFPVELIIISGVNNYFYKAEFPVTFLSYSLETEIENLMKIDVGLMPLSDDDTSRGKCGFKLIQYMGLGIPGLASAITVNKEIIDDNINGWLVYNDNDWNSKVKQIINQRNSLNFFGKEARKKVLENYSFEANYVNIKRFLFSEEDI